MGVTFEEIKDYAFVIGYKLDNLASIYLGLPVGQNMTRVVEWNNMMDRVR